MPGASEPPRNIDSLPGELFVMVLKHLKRETTSEVGWVRDDIVYVDRPRSNELVALCLVSKRLRERVNPFLYGSIHISGTHPLNEILFLRTLAEIPKVRPMVHRLGLENEGDGRLYVDKFYRTDHYQCSRRIMDSWVSASKEAVDNMVDMIHTRLKQEGQIPRALINWMLSRRDDGSRTSPCRPPGLLQTALYFLPKLEKLTLRYPVPLQVFLPDGLRRSRRIDTTWEATEEHPDNGPDSIRAEVVTSSRLAGRLPPSFCSNLVELTLDGELFFSKLPKHIPLELRALPLMCLPSIRKLRYLANRFTRTRDENRVPILCFTDQVDSLAHIRHLHVNQVRVDLQDVRALVSRMPHLETLHLQRAPPTGGLFGGWVTRPPQYEPGTPDPNYTVMDLLQPLAGTLTSLTLDLRLRTPRSFEMYNGPQGQRRITTSSLAFLTNLRHLAINSNALIGSGATVMGVTSLDLTDFFPPALRTLNIIDSGYCEPYREADMRPPAVKKIKIQVLGTLIRRIAKGLAGRKNGMFWLGEHVQEVCVSNEYGSVLAAVRNHGSMYIGRGVVELLEGVDGESENSAGRLREALGEVGVRFRLDRELDLGFEVAF